MGQVSRLKIIMLTALLVGTTILSWQVGYSSPSEKKIKIVDALSTIDGWQSGGLVPLDQNIVEVLKLDDYLNQSYRKENSQVQLYIGYYLSAEKIGAAHDPLICFPGQGWTVSDQEKGKLVIKKDMGISYSSMIVERPNTKSLILYWFQAHDKTNRNTFLQKINLILSKIRGKGEENAFVRITSEIGDRPLMDVRKDQLDFIKVFYPSFLQYIDGQTPTESIF